MATVTGTDITRISAKLYADNPEVIDLDSYIPLFHGWIQRRILDGVPIDVADYAHVPDGPGVMLISHEADRSLDLGEGRPGAVYARKRDGSGTLAERVAASITAADKVADDIEADELASGVRFGRDEILIQVMDRLGAPNDDAGFELLRPAVEEALTQVRVGRPATLGRVTADPYGPLTIRVLLA